MQIRKKHYNFWEGFSEIALSKGIRQIDLAGAFGVVPSTITRWIQTGRIPVSWLEVESALGALGLAAETGQLRALLEAAQHERLQSKSSEVRVDPSREFEIAQTFRLRTDNQRALLHLETAYTALRPDVRKGERLELFAAVCLELSASYGDFGLYSEALEVATEATQVMPIERGCKLALDAHHQRALMFRLSETELDRALCELLGLARTYSQVTGQIADVGPDTVARALRDAARAMARDQSRWGEITDLYGNALKEAELAKERRCQQLFHTWLDKAAFEMMQGLLGSAKASLDEANRYYLKAIQECHDWKNCRVDAKYGLVSTAFQAASGELDAAFEAVRRWRITVEAQDNREAYLIACKIVDFCNDPSSVRVLGSALLR